MYHINQPHNFVMILKYTFICINISRCIDRYMPDAMKNCSIVFYFTSKIKCIISSKYIYIFQL